MKLCKKSAPGKIVEHINYGSTVLPPLQSRFMDILVSFCRGYDLYYFFNLNFCKWAPYYLALAYLGASF